MIISAAKPEREYFSMKSRRVRLHTAAWEIKGRVQHDKIVRPTTKATTTAWRGRIESRMHVVLPITKILALSDIFNYEIEKHYSKRLFAVFQHRLLCVYYCIHVDITIGELDTAWYMCWWHRSTARCYWEIRSDTTLVLSHTYLHTYLHIHTSLQSDSQYRFQTQISTVWTPWFCEKSQIFNEYTLPCYIHVLVHSRHQMGANDGRAKQKHHASQLTMGLCCTWNTAVEAHAVYPNDRSSSILSLTSHSC